MSPIAVGALKVFAAIGLMLGNGVVLIYMLRKVLGRLHLRHGPMEMGPAGMFQTLMDVVKLLTKEDITPRAVDKWLFRLAPLMVFVPSLMAYAALPYSDSWRITSLDSGLLYTFAVLSLVPIGILMAGWASANKWSLLGGMRAAAQQIAYEVPLLLSVLPIVMLVGSANLGTIVEAQQGTFLAVLPRWFIMNPLFWPTFVLYVIASLVESNQTPFDMSEGESEIVAGFATEYSAMKFGLLFLSEFSNGFIVSALGVALFFGGWSLPWIPASWYAAAPIIGPAIFIIKTYIGIFFMMWIRGTFPRVRIDQMMQLGWMRLIPISLAWIVFSGIVIKVWS
ncbi:MAG: NADH-quinone oxidoreductase subunit NuoH [Actinobacteria bacterium HGW-Actinobacteria-6]|jgi:NADH-quinone oxidoreductase subunit H|nr:MAG: NADH-quinone oxidoreductase subunit NuoH [Actinobacteria bacterium HGW-Actinobacteria-6]